MLRRLRRNLKIKFHSMLLGLGPEVVYFNGSSIEMGFYHSTAILKDLFGK